MSDLDELERRAQRGSRASAAIAAAASVLDEEREAAISLYLNTHDGGNMTHDEYVRFVERLSTVRRIKSKLERHRADGERARETMAGDSS